MPATTQPPPHAMHNPWGTFDVQPTSTGLRFQIETVDPRNGWIAAGLTAKSVTATLWLAPGFWRGAGMLLLLLALDALYFFAALRRARLSWIEVRPDGLTIWDDARYPDRAKFFDRRSISERQLDCDTGLTFRYGVHDVQASTPFWSEREFEVFHDMFERAVAKLWFNQNL
jgi:hypothetical protein